MLVSRHVSGFSGALRGAVRICGLLVRQWLFNPVQMRSTTVFDRIEVRNLLALEWREAAARSVTVADGAALSLSGSAIREGKLSKHPRLIRLHLEGDQLSGDLRSSLDLLPFESESMQLIIVQHVFDAAGIDCGIHEEVLRVLAPGGLLLVYGFNPLSSWRFWWLREALKGMPTPRWKTAGEVHRKLITTDCMNIQRDYLGGLWPTDDTHPREAPGYPWHAVWVISARKERAAMRPVPLRRRPKRVVLKPALAQLASRRNGL